MLVVGLVRSQETTTEDFIVTESSNYTVTYNPGQNCLPYDGSVVPDCSKFVDPITKQPYYHEHSTSKIKIPLKIISILQILRLQPILGVRSCRRDLPCGVC